LPLFNNLAKTVAKPLPRMISPKAHAVTDFIVIGSFLATAAWFWRRSKRAALAALICAAADLSVSLLTDYPGGVKKSISFRTHGEIDLGLAAMAATMPEFLAFKDENEKKFFLTQGALMTAVTQLTKFPNQPTYVEKGIPRRRAA
jgi:hypothetical protein